MMERRPSTAPCRMRRFARAWSGGPHPAHAKAGCVARTNESTREGQMRKWIVSALAVLAAVGAGQAQDAWPQRQVVIVVPFTAGGTTDMFGRIFAQAMQQAYGTPFVVENKA